MVLADAEVSRRHALIHSHGQAGHWLVDFGSSNGVLLNNRRVSEPVRLRDRDQIAIAGHPLLFRQPRDLMGGAENFGGGGVEDNSSHHRNIYAHRPCGGLVRQKGADYDGYSAGAAMAGFLF